MHINNIHTTLELFPGLLDTEMPISSNWGQSIHSIYLFCTSIETSTKGGKKECTCILLFCDMKTDHVYEQRVVFPYTFIYVIDVIYDYLHSKWIVTFTVNPRPSPGEWLKVAFDIYTFSEANLQPIQHLLRAENNEADIKANINIQEAKTYPPKALLSFSRSNDTFPWLCGYFEDDGTQPTVFVMRWQIDRVDKPVEWIKIDNGFSPISYAFDASFMLFTCKYIEETTYVNRAEYSGLTGTWQLKIAAYDFNGVLMKQQYLPDVSFFGHHEDMYAIDDLERWIWPTLFVIPGPRSSETGHATCVAALQLGEAVHYDKTLSPDAIQKKRQGGLCCIDEMGHIIQYVNTSFGDKLSMCNCDTKIIGTDWWNGQWRLWCWLPLQEESRMITSTWTSDADRVTLIAVDQTAQQKQHHFWCLEEYSSGVRVSLFWGDTLQPVEHTWLPDIRLPFRLGKNLQVLLHVQS